MACIDARLCEKICDMLGGHKVAPSFSKMLETSLRLSRKRTNAQMRDEDVVATRYSILTDTTRKFVAPQLKGHQRLDMFERFLNAIDEKYMKRSLGATKVYFIIIFLFFFSFYIQGQREFHRAFTVACLPHIVGDGEWEKHRSSFLQRYDEDEFKGEVLVTTPRRFGW